jgi:VWFA-related protein
MLCKTIPLMSSICLILLFGSSAAAQENASRPHAPQLLAQPQRTVEIFVSAVDKDGPPVLDLKQEEIEITEEGHKLQMTSMKPARSEPLRAGILVDVSGSERNDLGTYDPNALADFIQAMLTPNGFAFFETFGENGKLVADWTDSPPQIGSAIQQAFKAVRWGPSSVYDAIYWNCGNKYKSGNGNNLLLILSDMDDNTSLHKRDDAVAAALRANVAVFVFVDEGGPDHRHGPETRRGRRVAEELSGKSGGSVAEVMDPKDFRKGLLEISQALAGRYILEFVPSPLSLPAGFHKFKVKCTRKGVRLLAPSAYFVADK